MTKLCLRLKKEVVKLHKEITYIGVAARKSGKRSGKDTWADAFIEEINNVDRFEHGIHATKMSLADPLKSAAKCIFGLSDEQMYGTQAQKESPTLWDWKADNKYGKQGKMTARDILQYFGTEVMREGFDFDIWVNSLRMNAIKELNTLSQKYPQHKLVVLVPDIRYPNETNFLDYLVDIYRKEAEIANTDGHISEKSGMLISDSRVNHSVDNNSTIVDLQEDAKEFARNFLKEDSA